MSKLDPVFLKEVHSKITDIHKAATTYGTYQSHELLHVIDHLSRVAASLADMWAEELETGTIKDSTPDKYLDGKLDIAYAAMMRYHKKTAEV